MANARRTPHAFFTNWRSYQGPLGTKLWLTARNRFRAVVLLKGCCGHDGEPGC
ncbi:MAG TPA: hypothetical protein VE646_10385 [Actinomycetota bacterium]|jgi:hypothetical protein|nr:hypothetical protein [Actinomycetota bacterium]